MTIRPMTGIYFETDLQALLVFLVSFILLFSLERELGPLGSPILPEYLVVRYLF